MITHNEYERRSTSELLSIVLVMTFIFLGFGIALLVLVVIHDTIVEYNKELKWFILLSASLFMLIIIVFIAGHAHLSLRKKHSELLAYEQNHLLPRTRNALTIEQKDNEEEFITFTDTKTHEIYLEMMETDTFSLNKLAIEVYGNTGGK